MRPLLALDTAGDRCAVALFRGDERLIERSEPMRRGHAERLMPMIDAALRAAGVAPGDLGAVAVCTGPGGFAGARIGVAAARGLALATGARAVGVSWFEALGEATTGRALVRLPHMGGVAIQRFAHGVAAAPPRLVAADDPAATPAPGERLVAPARPDEAGLAALAAVARRRGPGEPRPAPLYLRPPDAVAPATPPPALLP